MNSAIMDQACLVRGQQLFMGLETRKLELKEDDDKISDLGGRGRLEPGR